jgi:hypothetical protein
MMEFGLCTMYKMATFLFEQFIELDMAVTLQVVAPGYVENASVLRPRVRAVRRAASGKRSGGGAREQSTLVLARASAVALCELVLSKGIGTVIGGGIGCERYDFLCCEKVQVVYTVKGLWHKALPRYREGNLETGSVPVEGTAGSCRGH